MIGDEGEIAPKGIDVTTPHIARIYDYWLGGKDNYAADRAAAEQVMAATPTIKPGVTANRAFLSRAVRFMAGEHVTQFLDIGTGIPTADNTHIVAQAVNPASRVVYVDNDPIVLNHARALLSGVTAPTAFIDSDLRDTGRILDDAARLLDFDQPVSLLLIAILHCIPDADDPQGIINTLMDALAPGSYLAITHPGIDQLPEQMAAAEKALTKAMGFRVTFRTHEGVSRFFDGLDLLTPGVVPVQDWRPDPDAQPSATTGMWGAVARKPQR
ncbi:SAM-dependent methyltransferase [Actinomadura sp. 1N219]|uniref:SAM-dependent methyltransferase n=1 Tax=Actinomadura sp. 1N219 TaxID=3375152 RepID=UPI0037B3AE92